MNGRRAAMRVRLKGINWVTKRLADGRTVTHYYAWRGGPRLSGTPGSAEFVTSYQEAHRTRKVPTQGCLFTLIAEFNSARRIQGMARPDVGNTTPSRLRLDHTRPCPFGGQGSRPHQH